MIAAIAMPAALAAMPFQGLPEGATVVRGVVREHTPHPGPRPATTYVIDVEETLTGQAPRVLHLRLPGAVIDGVRFQTDLVPLWHDGDDVVATWLSNGPPPLWGQFTVVGEQLEPVREGAPTSVAALEETLVAHR